jgi:hypothetical protein
MSAWRRALPVAIVLLAIAALAVSAQPKFTNPLKKKLPIPGAPSAPAPPPGTAAAPAPSPETAPARQGFGDGVTPELVERLMKALKARVASYERAQAAARASKATEDRINQARGNRMTAAMEKQGVCEDAAKERDPRYKEAIRLNDLSNAANDKGDQAAADKYSEQATALNDALEEMAKKVCTGDCAVKALAKDPRNSEVSQKQQAAAKEKDPNKKTQLEAEAQVLLGMMRIEAEMSCGYMGAAKPTASEEAESAAAAQAAKDAQAGIDAEALKAGELTAEELARLIELSLGVCGGSSSPASAASKAAIQPRCGEVTSAMKAAGVS